jgi:hypothetical protein
MRSDNPLVRVEGGEKRMKLRPVLLLGVVLALAACGQPDTARTDVSPVTFSGEPRPKALPEQKRFQFAEANLEAPPVGLDILKPGETLWVELLMPIGVLPSVRRGESWAPLSPDCAHGAVHGLDEISMPTGYNHLIVSVVPGRAENHAANIVACDYAIPDQGAPEETPQVRFRVSGCFTVNEVAIPTARELVFQPRAAEACGL